MTNKEQVFDLIQEHPEGLDDDDISTLTGIKPRQQIQQLCNQLATSNRIRRQSVEKAGKRRKIHNFPAERGGAAAIAVKDRKKEAWRRRLSALVAATGKGESELLDEALHLLALKVLKKTSAAD